MGENEPKTTNICNLISFKLTLNEEKISNTKFYFSFIVII